MNVENFRTITPLEDEIEFAYEISNLQDGRPIAEGKDKMGKNQKPFKCQHIDDDGAICDRGFWTHSHLTRHAGKHSKDRPYPCPLPTCGKSTRRFDNAATHLKKHMTPRAKSKKGTPDFFEWPAVREAIEREYENSKIASKLVENLERWNARMTQGPSQRQRNANTVAYDREDVVCNPGTVADTTLRTSPVCLGEDGTEFVFSPSMGDPEPELDGSKDSFDKWWDSLAP